MRYRYRNKDTGRVQVHRRPHRGLERAGNWELLPAENRRAPLPDPPSPEHTGDDEPAQPDDEQVGDDGS